MAENRRPYKRLNKNTRDEIERYLNYGKSLTWIAGELGVSISTISREVKAHRTDQGFRRRSATGGVVNLCAHYKSCDKTKVCLVCVRKNHARCATCNKVRCANNCKEFVRRVCNTVEKAPYCCNSCYKISVCSFHKWRYFAADAQKTADTERVASRSGIDSDPKTIEAINVLVRPLLLKGQTPGQIWLRHADEIPFSRRTFYRYNELGLFGMTSLELTRKAGYKRRKQTPKENLLKIPSGHTYKDFVALSDEERQSVTELDTVMGTKHDMGSILTIHLKRLLFQIGLKLDVHDSKHVVSCIDYLEELLGKRFKAVYGLGLTDRGIEFLNTAAMEQSASFQNASRMKLYYCDARRADQKGSAERNHVELRKIISKGTSVDAITNFDLAEIFSHINSAPRRSLFGASPMELAMQILPKEFFDALGLRLIAPDEVVLNPMLLQKL